MGTLYSGALDGSLCVWQPPAEPGPGQPDASFVLASRMENVHPLGIVSLFAGPKGAYLASHSIEASQLLLHQHSVLQDKEPMKRIVVPTSPIHAYCLALCSEADEIWMGGLGPVLEMLPHPAAPQSCGQKLTLELPAHPIAPPIQHIACLAVTRALIALGIESHAILLYDRHRETWLPVALHEHTRPVRSLLFHQGQGDSCYLWSGGEDGRVHLYELQPLGKEEAGWQVHYRAGWNAHADWITCMLWFGEERLLVTASSGGQLKLWQVSPLLFAPSASGLFSATAAPERLALGEAAGEGPIWALCKGPGRLGVCAARGTCLSLYRCDTLV